MSEREKMLAKVFDTVMGAAGMPHETDPDYDTWLFDALITALEAAGVRLVPSEATQEMTGAVWATDLPRPDMHGDYQDLDIQLAARDMYRAMLAASPYAPTQKEQTHESD